MDLDTGRRDSWHRTLAHRDADTRIDCRYKGRVSNPGFPVGSAPIDNLNFSKTSQILDISASESM